MFRKHDLVPSRAMGRGVHLWRYGHYGLPLLVFPSAAGMAHEWETHGMIDALADLVDEGRLKIYCTESNVAEAWTRRDRDPDWHSGRHQAFEDYIVQELAPRIRDDCRTPDIPIATAGTSLGAYYSANFALKYPETFRYALCMSGRYDVRWLTRGQDSAAIYMNNPISYLPNMGGEHLELVRRHTHLVLVCGRGAWEDGNIEDTCALADVLAAKKISHQKDLWGHDVSHGWVWWKRQARLHLMRYLSGDAVD